MKTLNIDDLFLWPSDENLCNCQSWQELTKSIIDQTVFCYVHSGPQYKGPPFRFCPWCGTTLQQRNSADSDITVIDKHGNIESGPSIEGLKRDLGR